MSGTFKQLQSNNKPSFSHFSHFLTYFACCGEHSDFRKKEVGTHSSSLFAASLKHVKRGDNGWGKLAAECGKVVPYISPLGLLRTGGKDRVWYSLTFWRWLLFLHVIPNSAWRFNNTEMSKKAKARFCERSEEKGSRNLALVFFWQVCTNWSIISRCHHSRNNRQPLHYFETSRNRPVLTLKVVPIPKQCIAQWTDILSRLKRQKFPWRLLFLLIRLHPSPSKWGGKLRRVSPQLWRDQEAQKNRVAFHIF